MPIPVGSAISPPDQTSLTQPMLGFINLLPHRFPASGFPITHSFTLGPSSPHQLTDQEFLRFGRKGWVRTPPKTPFDYKISSVGSHRIV